MLSNKCYASGDGGVKVNYSKLARYLRLAAEHGHADSQFRLAMLHLEEKPLVPPGGHLFERGPLLRRAAAQGHPQAREYIEAGDDPAYSKIDQFDPSSVRFFIEKSQAAR
jgi:TPR repeat protein